MNVKIILKSPNYIYKKKIIFILLVVNIFNVEVMPTLKIKMFCLVVVETKL